MNRIYTFFADALINASDVGIPKPAGGNDTGLIKSVLLPVYFWAGSIAVLVIIIAGMFYVTANANPQRITRAKNAILYAVIGLAVILSAFGITMFVVEAL